MNTVIDEMVDRFLSWKLPTTVAADQCATDSSYPHTRTGTNLLTANEARQMIEHILTVEEWQGELSDEDRAKIDAAWEKHKAASRHTPNQEPRA